MHANIENDKKNHPNEKDPDPKRKPNYMFDGSMCGGQGKRSEAVADAEMLHVNPIKIEI